MQKTYKEIKALQKTCGTLAIAKMLKNAGLPLNMTRIILATNNLTIVK